MTGKSMSTTERFQALLQEYGVIAAVVFFSLTAIEIAVIMAMLSAGMDLQPLVDWIMSWTGWDASGALETAGYFGIAYALTRFLKPFQFAATFVLTPIVARMWNGAPADTADADD